MTNARLDKLISKSQKKYRLLMSRLRKVEDKIGSLYRKRFKDNDHEQS